VFNSSTRRAAKLALVLLCVSAHQLRNIDPKLQPVGTGPKPTISSLRLSRWGHARPALSVSTAAVTEKMLRRSGNPGEAIRSSTHRLQSRRPMWKRLAKWIAGSSIAGGHRRFPTPSLCLVVIIAFYFQPVKRLLTMLWPDVEATSQWKARQPRFQRLGGVGERKIATSKSMATSLLLMYIYDAWPG
jgi:hypothetical protein